MPSIAGSAFATPISLARPTSPADCAELLWEQLCRSPSIFGRIISIAGVRNVENGRYEYPLFKEISADLVNRTLWEMHREVFTTWLSFTLQQKQRDLTIFLASLNQGVGPGIQTLQAISKRLITLLPSHHIEPERQLFFQEFQLVSTTVRWADIEAGWIWPRIEDDAEDESPTLINRVRGWFKSRSSRRDPQSPARPAPTRGNDNNSVFRAA